MDLRLEKGQAIALPQAPSESCVFLFYVFNGSINVNETMPLGSGESVLIEDESPTSRAVETTDAVIFITKTNSTHFNGGMYSGSLHR
jgi:redox-sensitive bicupin YhaK (pirin superfamily)